MDKEKYTMEDIVDVYNMDNINKYNFNTNETINNFNFEDLINQHYIAAVIFFTDKQYIISYTENNGKGFHDHALARIYKDIHGGGKILSHKEYDEIKDKLKNYMAAKITFFTNKIHIFFEGLDNVNNLNYNSFLTFYSNFNELFEKLSLKVELQISFFDSDKRTYITANTLDFVLKYLQEHLENSILEPSNNDEIIIGVPTNSKKKKI